MRIGQGIDVHRFSEDPNRELWVGLVHVPEGPGLDGHSDADVATHALCDALLGAANLGDLGRHFPDSDPSYRGVSSRTLLSHCVDLISREGWTVANADVTIVAQRPRLVLFMPAMSRELTEVVGATVSVKATTTEGLGDVGDGQGMAASAVVLLVKS
jgi:2-C-methyl-D-erythritol 2,4-cyclodiphosphate synthase